MLWNRCKAARAEHCRPCSDQSVTVVAAAAPAASRSLTELFAGDPECAKPKQNAGQAGLARTHTFAGAGLDDELELKKLQVGRAGRGGVAGAAAASTWLSLQGLMLALEPCIDSMDPCIDSSPKKHARWAAVHAC